MKPLFLALFVLPLGLAHAAEGTEFKVVCEVYRHLTTEDAINQKLQAIPNIVAVSAPAMASETSRVHATVCVTVEHKK